MLVGHCPSNLAALAAGTTSSWAQTPKASAMRPTGPCDEPQPPGTLPRGSRRATLAAGRCRPRLPQCALQSRAMSPSHGAPFRGFRDHDESPFFCAPGHTPEETWDISVDRLARLLVQLGPLADAGPIEMSPALLCSWHREIFGALFPEHAGRLRSFREGRWEHVYFGVHNRGYRGTTPRELHRRLEKICTDFNTPAASIRESTPIDTYDAVHAATRLYAKVGRASCRARGEMWAD